MVADARELADGQELRARVCVVGAGPAGLSLTDRLASAGVDVLLLEAGAPELPGALLETTRSAGTTYSVATTRRRGTGGSSRAWNIVTPLGQPYVRLRELDDLDLRSRPGLRDAAWPLSRADLQGAYDDAWALYGLPPRSSGDAGRGGDARLGGDAEVRTFRFGPASVFTRDLPQRVAARASVRVLTGVVVTDVRTDAEPGVVSCLRCASHAGPSFTVRADVYVLAGGGIENARLLLASRSRHPQGLGNRHDHVGRYFMEHPHFAAAVVRPRDHRLAEDPAAWDVHVEDGVAVQRKYALTQEATEREGLLSAAFYLGPRKLTSLVLATRTGLHPERTVAVHAWREAVRARALPPRPAAALAHAAASLPQASAWVGRQLLAERAARRGHLRRAPVRTLTLRGMSEQVPYPDSRLRLVDERDAFGVPVAELDWRLTDTDWASMARSVQLLAPHLAALVGGRVDSVLEAVPRPHVVGGAHHLGTTRMSATARAGVVDPDGRVHGVTNLYVAGSSVFPTGGSANPTLTVVALALRLGDHLRERLRAPAGADLARGAAQPGSGAAGVGGARPSPGGPRRGQGGVDGPLQGRGDGGGGVPR